MDNEAKERLLKVLELVHSAQGHLIENVRPPADPGEMRKHFGAAWELLLEAADLLEPLTGFPLRPLPSLPTGNAA